MLDCDTQCVLEKRRPSINSYACRKITTQRAVCARGRERPNVWSEGGEGPRCLLVFRRCRHTPENSGRARGTRRPHVPCVNGGEREVPGAPGTGALSAFI
jgi:hypothetical protein